MAALKSRDLAFAPGGKSFAAHSVGLHPDGRIVFDHADIDRVSEQHAQYLEKVVRRPRRARLRANDRFDVVALEWLHELVAVLSPEPFKNAAPERLRTGAQRIEVRRAVVRDAEGVDRARSCPSRADVVRLRDAVERR